MVGTTCWWKDTSSPTMDTWLVKLKILVTGSAGLVGYQLVKDLSSLHKVFSCYNKSKPEFGIPTKMDLLNHEMISNVLLET